MAVSVTFGTPKKVHEKVWEVPFSADGKQASYVLKYWDSSAFKDSIKEGVTVPVEIEKKPARNNPDVTEHWIKSVDGVGDKPKGGGGRAATPRTPLEIHASCVAGVIKSCLDNSLHESKDIERVLGIYWAQMEKAK